MSSDSALTSGRPFVKKAGLIAALLFSGGCETIVELSDLMDGLVQEFDLTSETVGLMLSRGGGTTTVGGAGQAALELEPNDGPGILTVTVTDSTTLRLPDEARQELANRIAGFVRDHFELYGEVVRVRISFVEVQKIVFFFGLFYNIEATHRGTLDLSTDSLELYLAVRQSADLVELGRPEEALAVLDAALPLDPNFSPAQDVRAAALLMLDRTAEAAPTDDLGAVDPTQPRVPPGLEEPTFTPTDDLGAADPTQPRILPGLEEPTFTPMTVRPEIRNRNEVIQALMREYPPILRDAGIGGQVVVWFFISETGQVLDRRVSQSSGHVELDAAALRVADVFRFTPALNREQIVRAWIQLPITFQVQ